MHRTSLVGEAPAAESNQDKLKRYVLEQGHVSGDALPPEPQLARELGISRASLREAISGLQSQGILESQHGRGTFVSSFSFASVVSSLAFHISLESNAHPNRLSHDLNELVAMRELIESALVAELIDSYRQTDILALYSLTNQMAQAAERGEEFLEQDFRFHTYLYRRSGNSMLQKMLDSFWDICNQVRMPIQSIAFLRDNAANHRAIVDAIADRNKCAASDAMKTHFQALRLPFANSDFRDDDPIT